MLQVIKNFFSSSMALSPEEVPVAGARDIRLAACALLLELAYADDEFTDDERQHLESALRRQFGLDSSEAEQLLALAQQEREEIDVIKSFLPQQLSDDDVRKACQSVVQETGAQGLRDMGKCMSALKSKFAGQMDFSAASQQVKHALLDKS